MKIIHPGLAYQDALPKSKLETLDNRRKALCKSFFQKLKKNSDKLNYILTPQPCNTSLRSNKTNRFLVPKFKTDRFKNSFIPYALLNFQ